MISIERITWVRALARLACSLGLLAAACGDDTLQPPPVAHVSLALRVEAVGTSLDPRYRIVATVTNDGDVPVLWFSGCWTLITLRGPDGQIVELHEPYACVATSPQETLPPGEVLSESYWFTGIIYDLFDPVDAPPGTYTVDAGFGWFAPGLDGQRLSARQTFEWHGRTAPPPLDGRRRRDSWGTP